VEKRRTIPTGTVVHAQRRDTFRRAHHAIHQLHPRTGGLPMRTELHAESDRFIIAGHRLFFFFPALR